MEKRKNTISSLKVCRFCLTQDEVLQSLYDKGNKLLSKNSVTLPLKILSTISVEVFASDNMPSFICQKCKYYIDVLYSFKQHVCRRTDETIINFIQNGSSLEPTAWPVLLNKVYKTSAKPPPEKQRGMIKTFVEGGATVQVTAEDTESDGEESEYDVKIEDGDESSACINVIASKNVPDNKSKPKKVIIENQDMEAINPISDGCWACDECDCTYPLQQLLELHKMKKHRERTAKCDLCAAKFFSKYDLEAHKLCHSDETPFECVACQKQFKRLSLLKRHEKMIHPDLLQLKCEACPATFISAEDLKTHKKRHHGSGQRPHVCEICDKRFTMKNALQRHVLTVHTPKPELSCEYCPERFSSVPKLAKHVRTHAGSRAYPCKYCDKSFLKSHHYTRHIRLRHRAEIGLAGAEEQYRCEQCDDTFTTQDDLIYHSAIHATQNLTCPLCQEHFEDVDAVTAHIKSHVSGAEFLCDFCELVFTSKEKLKKHALAEHEEEIKDEDLDHESSMDVDDYDENSLTLKEEDDHMVVEIKKAESFMLLNPTVLKEEDKTTASLSEGSESEGAFPELAIVKAVDTPAVTYKSDVPKMEVQPMAAKAPEPVRAAPQTAKLVAPAVSCDAVNDNQTSIIVKKAEVAKKKIQISETVTEKKPKVTTAKSDSSTAPNNTNSNVTTSSGTNGTSGTSGGGTTDKSLRLLEKELQELKRTTVRNDTNKIAAKSTETPKRRQPSHASTPKLRSTDDKKGQVSLRNSTTAEKKVPERRAVKENKEPKDNKETRTNAVSKEDKEKPNIVKEERDAKDNDTSTKNLVKNGASDKNTTPDDGVRRSTRPSKIKDYAKMIRDRTQVDSGDDDDSDDDDEEYVEPEKAAETRSSRGRRSTAPKPAAAKPAAKATPSPANPRKRGRPRKEQAAHTSAKVMKDDPEKDDESKDEAPAAEQEDDSKPAVDNEDSQDNSETHESKDRRTNTSDKSAVDKSAAVNSSVDDNVVPDGNKTPNAEQKPTSNLIVSPTGQTLKKVPIKALPPGVKPLPLPTTARAMNPGETCQMQIGKKVVKVQKIVMTKAEVEAMAKKGLLEMKDGTMVLKPGIKLHSTTESSPVKPAVDVEGASKESQIRTDRPTRCELDEEAMT